MNKRKSAFINLILLSGLFILAAECLALSIDRPEKSPLGAKPVTNLTKDYEGMEWEGHLSEQREEFVKVVVDNKEWDELWRRAFDKTPPEVDFENYAVACVFLGHSADWLYSIGFGKPYERENLLVIPFELADIILELSGPFKASGQYRMKVFKRRPGFEMTLENTPVGRLSLPPSP